MASPCGLGFLTAWQPQDRLHFLLSGTGHQVAEWKGHHFLCHSLESHTLSQTHTDSKGREYHKLTQIQREGNKLLHFLMAWSPCRRACGIGEIVATVFGKYNQPWCVGEISSSGRVNITTIATTAVSGLMPIEHLLWAKY